MVIRKGFNGLVKDVDTEGRTVTGYFSTFNFKDSDGDIIVPGAFTKTIQERGPVGKNRIFHLWQHRSDMILGKPTVLMEDAKGLYFETTFAKTALGNDALQLYLDGILNEHSIGFNVIQHERNEDEDTTLIKEVRLWEGSTVTWGANENTYATGVKELYIDDNRPITELTNMEYIQVKTQLSERIARIMKALQKGKYTDDTFELLQYELAAIETAIKSLRPDEPPEPTDEQLIEAFKKGFNNGK